MNVNGSRRAAPVTRLRPVPRGGFAPATPKAFHERIDWKHRAPSRWSGPNSTLLTGVKNTLGLHFHLTQPRPVWVTSLNDLTGESAGLFCAGPTKTAVIELPSPFPWATLFVRGTGRRSRLKRSRSARGYFSAPRRLSSRSGRTSRTHPPAWPGRTCGRRHSRWPGTVGSRSRA